MDLKDFALNVDDTLIDRVFQPIVDKIMPGKSPWPLGMSFQLGSLVFLGFVLLLPLFFSFFRGEEIVFPRLGDMVSFLIGWLLFAGFSKMAPSLREGMANPFRPALWGFRLFMVALSLYSLFSVLRTFGHFWALREDMLSMSNIVFMIGLYFMACRISPPKRKKNLKNAPIWQGHP